MKYNKKERLSGKTDYKAAIKIVSQIYQKGYTNAMVHNNER